jgi:hypothetical protein
VFNEISMEQFKQNLRAAGIPPNVEENFVDVWLGLADFGCRQEHNSKIYSNIL